VISGQDTGQKPADLNGEKFQGILGALISLITPKSR